MTNTYNVHEKMATVNEICRGLWAFEYDNMFKYLYPFTTENIAGYLPFFNFGDKSLLTVGSSADQVMNAILMGANNVSVIDLCAFTKEYFYLKKAAVQIFNREKFLKFFCYYRYNDNKANNLAFNKKDYLELRDLLKTYDEETLYFWDSFLMGHRNLKVRKRLFNYDESAKEIITQVNEYLKSDTVFNELKSKLDNTPVNFTIGNIFDTPIEGTFDNINLSNINTYCSPEKLGKLFNKMFTHLNDEGMILIAYLYSIDFDIQTIYESGIDNYIRMLKNLPKDIKLYSFDGIGGIKLADKSLKDSIITYKKVKKI